MNDKQLTEHLRHYLWKLAGLAGCQLNLWDVRSGVPCHAGQQLRGGFQSDKMRKAFAAFKEATE